MEWTQHSLVDEWKRKPWHTHTKDCYSDIKNRKKNLSLAATWWELEGNMLSLRNQTQSQAWHCLPLMPALWRLKKEELCEFKANLFCIVSFRVARVTYRDHVSIQTNKRIQIQKHKQHIFPPTGRKCKNSHVWSKWVGCLGFMFVWIFQSSQKRTFWPFLAQGVSAWDDGYANYTEDITAHLICSCVYLYTLKEHITTPNMYSSVSVNN